MPWWLGGGCTVPARPINSWEVPLSDDLFVYFDGVEALGQFNGSIQLELVANVLDASDDGGVKVRRVTTAHLRCSATAAADLAQAITKALEMLKNPDKNPVAVGKMN
jgi:hypothetical protein